ncbi:MAG TPA: hypothetical protein VE988_24595, partial [Gemmataceae bacterium]|nr:hypothetical protein [Gemmataceae bacterium]
MAGVPRFAASPSFQPSPPSQTTNPPPVIAPGTPYKTWSPNGSSVGAGDQHDPGCFCERLWQAYCDVFNPKKDDKDEKKDDKAPEPPRRALPSPWSSP